MLLLCRRWLAWLLLLPLGPAAAQTLAEAVLRGQVLDADTHQPVPNAQVGIAHNRLGTSTNADGRFALRVPAAYQGTELEVALLGYQRYRQVLPVLPGPELVINLKISPASLGNVTVTASATGIIREAVRRIPRNFPTRPTQLTGFYRESDEETASGRYDYLAEGLLQVYKPGYQHPHQSGYVRVLQARRVELRRRATTVADLARINWMAGGLVPHRFDFVRERAEFISERHFKEYQYGFNSQTTFEGRPVYVITFGPRPGSERASFAGRLYIDVASYAFLGAEWHRTPAGIAHEHLLTFEASERAYRAYYQQFVGRFYLKSVWYNTLGRPLAGQVRHHLAEYLTTAIDTGRVAPPPYPERSQYTDIFLRTPVPYDSAFWQSTTTLLPAAPLRRALLDQARERRADSLLRAPAAARLSNPTTSEPALGRPDTAVARPRPAPRPRRLRLGYSYGVGVLALSGAGAALQAEVAPAGYAFRAVAGGAAAVPLVAPFVESGYQLYLPAGLLVYSQFRTVLGQLRGGGWEAGLGWVHNLNPRGRPVRLRLGVGYLNQSLAHPLGTYDNPDEGLRLAGTRLGYRRLSLAVQNSTEALHPSLGLGLELSRRWEVLASAGCLVPLATQAGLLVQEDSFWHDNEAVLPLPAAEVQVRVNGQPASTLPWQLGRLLAGLSLVHQLR
ncbi:carboxypeptidase-like regulatory domain-containing protein [Hymenobacter sp. RP-2-7]|uniref:Carboxypeptidase-like regulatory domain-containing protein n=1 Tax=Hymenobacter polaris TaxID=2682546 RepID=A0A7Y0AHK2_9BACT|nr:carboxypeptidase-like regulatory domain-containing protein [Hymenobacter polaris]NML67462.1 carboxypeptidase-like regulatory domain-containing protein [Hymenobacter polaris]